MYAMNTFNSTPPNPLKLITTGLYPSLSPSHTSHCTYTPLLEANHMQHMIYIKMEIHTR